MRIFDKEFIFGRVIWNIGFIIKLFLWKVFGNCVGKENDDIDDVGEVGDIVVDVKCFISLLIFVGWVYE